MVVTETRKYEQRARAESAEETRQRILEAAYDCLRGAPAEAVSLERVARLAGVARSTVYLVFSSRAELFEALGKWVFDRAGFRHLVEAMAHADACDSLRESLVATSQMFAAERDVIRALLSMPLLDPDAVAGLMQWMDEGHAGGIRDVAERLHDQGMLRPEITVDEAVDILWVITSFDAFDLLYTGRGLAAAEVARCLVTMAERALYPDTDRRGVLEEINAQQTEKAEKQEQGT